MRFISADYIFPISSEPIAEGIIQMDDDGTIIKVGTKDSFPTIDIQHHSGIILPGFVNAHCHLELSHMKGLCDTGVGLVRFIEKVVSLRSFDAQIIKAAIQEYDAAMFKNGIQKQL